uniref:SSD domain-containing protein n=1 Tax=Wuchereria bancrofti TaxID=6293 RepID=A0A1I8EAR0_WUCBA
MVSCGKGGWTRRAHFVEPIRSILDEYPQYNVTLFDYDGTIFDLISNVKGAISTILCMLPVFVISTESIKSFAKTIITVILLSIFHGIIIVPAILSLRISRTNMNEGTIMATNHNTNVKSECKNETVM